MLSKLVLSDAAKRLLARERAEVLAGLQRAHKRSLDDNPEGSALIENALGRALLVGVRAQCELDWLPGLDRDAPPTAWEDWQNIRDETPEGREWPDVLVQRKPEAVEKGGDLLEAAAAELDLRRREREDLRWAGEQCAEAGAALVRALTQPPGREPAPVWAEPGPAGPVEADGTVRVAWARTQADCELLQGMLGSAGIPSITRAVDIEGFWGQASGRREIYVPAAAAARAQEILATSVRE
ncbi:MAG TPA: hypothetical protein VJU60_03945 [Thermoleophilaceae bacterium]|nr:hypothetical protein [Thermoleophilaceae bacterium]